MKRLSLQGLSRLFQGRRPGQPDHFLIFQERFQFRVVVVGIVNGEHIEFLLGIEQIPVAEVMLMFVIVYLLDFRNDIVQLPTGETDFIRIVGDQFGIVQIHFQQFGEPEQRGQRLIQFVSGGAGHLEEHLQPLFLQNGFLLFEHPSIRSQGFLKQPAPFNGVNDRSGKTITVQPARHQVILSSFLDRQHRQGLVVPIAQYENR